MVGSRSSRVLAGKAGSKPRRRSGGGSASTLRPIPSGRDSTGRISAEIGPALVKYATAASSSCGRISTSAGGGRRLSATPLPNYAGFSRPFSTGEDSYASSRKRFLHRREFDRGRDR